MELLYDIKEDQLNGKITLNELEFEIVIIL